jgi:uncharacterized membrane protein
MFLRQVVLQRGIPFEIKLPANAPTVFGSLTKKQFDTEINKCMDDIKNRILILKSIYRKIGAFLMPIFRKGHEYLWEYYPAFPDHRISRESNTDPLLLV